MGKSHFGACLVLVGLAVSANGQAFTVYSGHKCAGKEVDVSACPDLQPCAKCEHKKCVFTDWDDWVGREDCTGLAERHRNTVEDLACSAPCDGVLVETKSIPGCVKPAVDCVLGPWSAWLCKGGMPCGDDYTKQVYRSRKIMKPAELNGKPCSGLTEMTKPCGTPAPPIPCKVDDWNPWSSCSKTCDVGRRTRVRRVLSHALNGGAACTDALMEVEMCNEKPCYPAGPCVYTDWMDWEGCCCHGRNEKTRKRTIKKPAVPWTGLTCKGMLVEAGDCGHVEVPKTTKDCTYTQWTLWGKCDKTCDGGQHFRSRKEINGPLNGGKCPMASLEETQPCNTQDCTPDHNCELSEWSAWGECSSHCGKGEQIRTRKVLKERTEEGKGCVGAIKMVQPCMSKACVHIDCVWDDWAPYSECTCSCGGGSMTRNRKILTAPKLKGKTCDAHVKYEVTPCNTQSCDVENCVDGVWSPWSEWTDGTVTCDFGYVRRHRSVATYPTECGKPLEGPKEEFKAFDSGVPCKVAGDCLFADWGEWSDCSCSCFGHTERTRTIKQYATQGGKPCIGDLKEAVSCHPGVTPAGTWGVPPPGCQGPPPKPPCEYSPWSEWAPCSKTCNGGHATRHRTILNRPCIDTDAPNPMIQSKSCGMQKCPEVCLDCVWGPWGVWSACTKCGGQKTRHRSIKQYANHCGKPCPLQASQETAPCKSECRKEFYCFWTAWGPADECSATCGTATQTKQRHLKMMEKTANFTLTEYLFIGDEDTKCSGRQTEITPCKLAPCAGPVCKPKDCIFGAWSDWAKPSCEGLCTRNRVRVVENNECGKPCEGPLVETKVCPAPCDKKRDCEFGPWSKWTHCRGHSFHGTWSDQSLDQHAWTIPQRTRYREIVTELKNEGLPCMGALKETEQCAGPVDHGQNCRISEWSAWSDCTKTCDGGIMERTRHILETATQGGLGCTLSLNEIRGCNIGPAHACGPKEEMCVFGTWTEWARLPHYCAHHEGSDKELTGTPQCIRNRTLTTVPGKNDPAKCVGPTQETTPCPDPIQNCVMSDWTPFDSCDKTCDGGQQQRHRQINKLPDKGGLPCPSTIVETSPCNTQPCGPQKNCELSPWSVWSSCTTTCGSGQQTRSRKIVHHATSGGFGCTGLTKEIKGCGVGVPCGGTDCVWGVWHDWSQCTCSCDGGVKRRARLILTFPTKGGALCPAKTKNEVVPCNTQPCGECVNGAWGPWSSWETCTSTCMGGVTWRHRSVAQRANDCGIPATGLQQDFKKCNIGIPCIPDRDCQWRDWGEWHGCSATCDGTKRRVREIGIQGREKGAFCVGPAEEIVVCNPAATTTGCIIRDPAIDCKLSAWSSWGSCSTTCETGQQDRKRTVLVEPKNGGKTCVGPLVEVKGCTGPPCNPALPPVDCVWCQWNDWGDCTKCAGQSFRTRSICTYNKNGGKPCAPSGMEPEYAREAKACPKRECHPPAYCAWGQWSEWGGCSNQCGSGTRTRTRELMLMNESPYVRLSAQNQDLEKRMEVVLGEKTQHLAIAFAAGAASLILVLSVVRGIQAVTSRAMRRPQQTSQTYDNLQFVQ